MTYSLVFLIRVYLRLYRYNHHEAETAQLDSLHLT